VTAIRRAPLQMAIGQPPNVRPIRLPAFGE
jgi:hypothetical protein